MLGAFGVEEVEMRGDWFDVGRVLGRARAVLGGVSVAEALDLCGALRGDQEALWLERGVELEGFRHARWSFGDVARFVRRAAGALELVAKVQAGERVAVWTGNGVEQPLLSLAAMRCGAVAVPLNPRLKLSEVGYILGDCGAQVAVVSAQGLEEVIVPLLARGEAPGLRCVLVEGVWGGEALPGGVACVGLWEALEGASEGSPPAESGGEEVCSLFYTSGTTGFPKGAMLTGEGLLRSVSPLMALPGGGPGTVLLALPSAHIMGFAAFFQAMLVGARVVYLSRFVAARVVDWLASGQVEAFVGVPTMYQILEEAGALSRDLKGVRVFMSAADVMPPGLMGRFKRAGRSVRVGPLGAPALFVEMYGSVELSGAAMVRVSLPWWDPSEGAFVGWPLPGVQVEVRGEGGRRAAGEVGELWVKAPGALKGYVGQEEATQEVVQEGWVRTGDLGSKGRFGEVYFAGRVKEVIKVGGYSVFPAEVEEALRGYPGVSRAVVFGVSDGVKGAAPVAVVCPAAGARVEGAEVEAWIRGEVAGYKAPRRVFVMEEGELPYGATGKVQRRELEARFAGALVEAAGVR